MASDWTERFGNKLLPSSEESHALVVPSTEEQRRSKQSHSRVETDYVVAQPEGQDHELSPSHGEKSQEVIGYERLSDNNTLATTGSNTRGRNLMVDSPPEATPLPAFDYTDNPYKYESNNEEEVSEIIHTASRCYLAHDYNRMITTLLQIRNTSSLSSKNVVAINFGLGVGYFKLSINELATTHLLKAEEVADENGDKCILNYYQGEVEYSQNKFMSAIGYYEVALKFYCYESVGDLYHISVPTLSVLYCKEGSSYRYATKVLEAIRMYRKGIESARAAANNEDELSGHTSLGNLFQGMGDYTRAVEEYDQSIRIAEKIQDTVALGWAHGNIGNAYLGLYKRDKALSHLMQALDLTLRYEPVPQAIGRAYNNLGTAYQAMSNLAKAKDYYNMALNQAIYGNDLPGQARVYGNLGNLLMIQCKYSEAIAHYTETLYISRDRATQMTAYHNRGCARYERAEEEKKKYSEWGEHSIVGKSNLIFVGHDMKDCEEEHRFVTLPEQLLKHYRDANSDLEKVMKRHEQTFKDIKGSPRGLSLSVSLFETNAKTFQRLEDCSFILDRWQQALVYAEQSRARTLGELLLRKNQSQIRANFHTPLDLPQIVGIARQQELPIIYMAYTGSRLLTWLLVPNKETDEVKIDLCQMVLDANQFDDKSFDIMLRYHLSEMLTERRLEMYGECNYNSTTMLNELYEIVAKPILHLLKSVLQPDAFSDLKDVILIPDGYVKLIPMAALQDPTTRSFLGDRLRFHIMHSLLTMGTLHQLPPVVVTVPMDSHEMCIVGNPSIPQFTYAGENWKLGRLPFAEEEAHRVAHALYTRPILGNEATKNVVLSKLQQAKVVHIATHGSATGGFLVFAGANVLSESEEKFTNSLLLFPEDIENLTIPTALVVLSSCDSGRGVIKADGIQGIARSFLLAGAQAVLTSLWRVPDESACFFMQFFYTYLVDGFSSFIALQKACQSIRCYKKYSYYIHWSGYQLQGREISFTSKIDKSDAVKLQDLLGSTSRFPLLQKILELEKNLITNPPCNSYLTAVVGRAPSPGEVDAIHRTDIQLIYGSLAASTIEIPLDYIFNSSSHYTGGIVWINGMSNDFVRCFIRHANQILVDSSDSSSNKSKLESSSNKLADYATSIKKPFLLVLDQFKHLPLSDSALKALLTNPNVHVIITSPVLSNLDDISIDADKELTRGCALHELTPIPVLLNLQRIAYSIMKDCDLSPMNEEQDFFEDFEELTAGNPALLNFSTSVLKSVIVMHDNPKDGLSKFHNEVIKPAQIAIKKAYGNEVTDMVTNATDCMEIDTTNFKDVPDNVMYFTKYLLKSLSLTPQESLYIDALSIFSGAPIHETVLDTIEAVLLMASVAKESYKLQKRLKDYNILVKYPSPVLKVPPGKQRSSYNCGYYYMPAVLSEIVETMMDKQTKVMSASLCHYSLLEVSKRLHSDSLNFDDYGGHLELQLPDLLVDSSDDILAANMVGLRQLLVNYISGEWSLFGGEVFLSSVQQYVNEKILVSGDEGVAELTDDITS